MMNNTMTYDFNVQEQEERDFHVSSDSEWDRAEACEAGAAEPDRAWILTDRDVWHANPYYTGPAVPHPEDDYDGYDDEAGDPALAVAKDYDDIPV